MRVVGTLRGELGLGYTGRSIVEALEAAGVRVHAVSDDDLAQPLMDWPRLHAPQPDAWDATIYAMNPERVARAWRQGLVDPRDDGHRICVPFYELDRAPRRWMATLRCMDELWVASEYVRAAMARDFDGPIRTLDFPLPVGLETTCRRPSTRFRFGFAYDAFSSTLRKNPVALIQAFQAAFPDDPTVELVIKTRFLASFPRDRRRLMRAAAKDERIQVIDEDWPASKVRSFIAGLDCYVSLHRSEGLGLTLAEAMDSGVPVIATGYSGNLQFMSEREAWLVGYRLVRCRAKAYEDNRRGCRWAEASVRDAVRAMRTVRDGGPEVERRVRRARERVRGYSLDQVAPRFRIAAGAAPARGRATPLPRRTRVAIALSRMTPRPVKRLEDAVRRFGRSRPWLRGIYRFLRRTVPG